MYLARCLVIMFFLLPLHATQPEVKVWATQAGSRKLYHCVRSRWYGAGTGKEMGECTAIREGYTPATGTGCGSVCGSH